MKNSQEAIGITTQNIYFGKLLRAYGGCLGTERRRRTRLPAISLGELEASYDPGVSEWGNPVGVMPDHLVREVNPGK